MTPEAAFGAAVKWLATAFMGLVTWFGLDQIRKVRGHGVRIAKLEREQVTRQDLKDQLDEVRSSFNATVQNEHSLITNAIEKRFDDLHETQQLILNKLIPGRGP